MGLKCQDALNHKVKVNKCKRVSFVIAAQWCSGQA